ncbi:MAG: acetyl-CoA carboxylase biotin carboxylase subunit, partial [Planctomycetes bacterium]|nr:acetyl-CoA carboxylase biotin carboxylase subunit [Planctomycetota bacterium]
HAIECRINAEDPDMNFRPSPGRIGLYVPPGGPGVRVDSHLFSNYKIPSHYDSMVAKLIVHRATREEAIETMERALSEYVIEGIRTTIPLYLRLLRHADFRAGDIDTSFVGQFLAN